MIELHDASNNLIASNDDWFTSSDAETISADPNLELRDGNGNLIEANNDWQQSPEAAKIMADGKASPNAKGVSHGPDPFAG